MIILIGTGVIVSVLAVTIYAVMEVWKITKETDEALEELCVAVLGPRKEKREKAND